MKSLFLIFIVFNIYSCGTTPPEVLAKLKEKQLPGHWVSFKNDFGANTPNAVESFVHISCDGEIRYEINEPYALFFKKSNDDGNIKSITDNSIEFESWLSLSWKAPYHGPIKNDDGYFELSFKGKRFVTKNLTDCSRPPITLYESFGVMSYLKKVKDNKCF